MRAVLILFIFLSSLVFVQAQGQVGSRTTEAQLKQLTGKNLVTDAEKALIYLKGLSNNPKGNWNPATNTPTLSASASGAGDAYDVTIPTTGTATAPFVGANFSTTTVMDNGDQIKSNGTAWYWIQRVGVPTDLSVTSQKVAPNAITPDKEGFAMVRLTQSRALTLNLQTNTLSWVTLTIIPGGNSASFATSGSMSVSAVISTNPSGLKTCYYDGTTVQFKDFYQVPASGQILFYYYGGVITTANPQSIVLINSSGVEVSTTPNNTIGYSKQAYYMAKVSQSRAITVNLQANTLTWQTLLLLKDNDANFVNSGVTSLSTASSNQAVPKICYYDPAIANMLQYKDYNTTIPPTGIILFYVYNGVITAANPQSVVLINSSGVEVSTIAANSIGYTETKYPKVVLTQSRIMTLNLQNNTLSWSPSLLKTIDNSVAFVTSSTVSVSATMANNPGSLKVCYYDPGTSSIKFDNYDLISSTAAQIIFYYYGGVITCSNPSAIVLINSSGTEVNTTLADGSVTSAKITTNAITYNKLAYYMVGIAEERVLTINAKTKTISWTKPITLLTGGTSVVFGPSAGSIDITAALASNPAGLKTFYYLPGSGYQFSAFDVGPVPGALVIFFYYNGVVYVKNPRSLVNIDANGDEQGPAVTRNARYWGDETRERLIVPDVMYGITGKKLPLYKSSVIGSRDYVADLKLTVMKRVSGQTPWYHDIYGYYPLDASVLGGSFEVGISPEWNTDLAYRKAVTYTVRSYSSVVGQSLTFLGFGDSLFENGVPGKVKDELVANGVNATVTGTRGTTMSEGRGGWTTENFIGKNNIDNGTVITRMPDGQANQTRTQNPFLKLATSTDKTNWPQYCFRNTGSANELSYQTDSDKTGNFYIFDFAYYLSAHNQATPNIVLSRIGTNDNSANSTSAGMDATVANIEFMFRQIFTAVPTVKIIYTMPAIGTNSAGRDRWKNISSVWLERMITKINSLKSTFPNLYFAPSYLHMNPDWSYPFNASANLNSNNNSQKLTKTEFIHPDEFGITEDVNAIAACVVNVMP